MKELDYCPLLGTNRAFSYTPSDKTTPEYLAERFRQIRQERFIGDDYDLVQSHDWLEPGGFK